MNDVRAFGQAQYLSGETVDFSVLDQMRPGDSMIALMTERVNAKTLEHKWFRETVYCVSLQDERKIIVYISDRTKERQP